MSTNKVIRGYFPESDTPPELLEVAKHSKSYEAGAKLATMLNKSRQNNQTGDTEMSNSHVTHAELRNFEEKLEAKFEHRFDKLDARMDRMDANIAKMSDGIVALTAKVDHIPMQLENQKLQTKLDIEGMLKEQNKEMKGSARFWAGLTIAAIPVFFLLFEKFSPILSAASEVTK